MIQTIDTNRLTLHPVNIAHSRDFHILMADPSVSEYLAWLPHKSQEETRTVIENLEKSNKADLSYHWTILFDKEVCGLISLIDIKRQHLSWTLNRCELAYWVSPKHQNKGIASEAAKAVIEFAFDKANFHKIIVAHDSENEASQAVIKKLNFTYVGEFKEAYKKNEHWHNLKYYELIGN